MMKTMAGSRRTGRRRGAGDTRAAILEAARASFASNGYDRTTIRGVAAAATVDPALVHYFFADKERLFTAAMNLPIKLSDLVDGVLAGDRAGLGERLARAFVRIWGDEQTGPVMRAVLRGAASHEPSAALVREYIGRELLGRIAAGLDVPDPDLRADLTASQVVGVALLRYVLGVEPIASADPETLIAWIAPTLQRYLTGRPPHERSVGSVGAGDTVGQGW
jgi:AcrR family transcriptional regulator